MTPRSRDCFRKPADSTTLPPFRLGLAPIGKESSFNATITSSGDALDVMVGRSFHGGGGGCSTARRMTLLAKGSGSAGTDAPTQRRWVVRVRSSSRPYSFITLFPAIDRQAISKWAKNAVRRIGTRPGTLLVLAEAAPTVLVARANKQTRPPVSPGSPLTEPQKKNKEEKKVCIVCSPPGSSSSSSKYRVSRRRRATWPRQALRSGAGVRNPAARASPISPPSPSTITASIPLRLGGVDYVGMRAIPTPFGPLARHWHTICGRVRRDRCRGGGGTEACAAR
ncbi:hypothetical protein LX32DRAFT_170007 [Colletotrichum zoysiae]|uniref:Uncharacterized protein n=1 Tax=Colletotrichum zoysiae TaxID=1216348 RepID=A0AAD9M4C8_9PEZI|nr:hypothetical protein LX32DRAFT_170007 [Colletotrichum zoysiae]